MFGQIWLDVPSQYQMLPLITHRQQTSMVQRNCAVSFQARPQHRTNIKRTIPLQNIQALQLKQSHVQTNQNGNTCAKPRANHISNQTTQRKQSHVQLKQKRCDHRTSQSENSCNPEASVRINTITKSMQYCEQIAPTHDNHNIKQLNQDNRQNHTIPKAT